MNRRIYGGMLAAVVCLLAGCGSAEELNTVSVRIDQYEKQAYELAEVTRMNLNPQFTVELVSENHQTKYYSAPFDGLRVKEVYVAKGDMVQSGQILLSFESKEIEDEIKELQKSTAEDALLKDHYEKLLAIGEDEGTRAALTQLTRELETKLLRISELQTQMESYSLRAELPGMVTIVAPGLKGTEVQASKTLIYLSYGDGIYKGVTNEQYDFKVGEEYKADFGNSSYAVTLLDIAADEAGKKLVFQNEIKAGEFCPWDTLNLTLAGQPLDMALSLPEECIFYLDDQAYVYQLNEQGYRKATPVTCGPTDNGMIAILSGLEEGEKVVKE